FVSAGSSGSSSTSGWGEPIVDGSAESGILRLLLGGGGQDLGAGRGRPALVGPVAVAHAVDEHRTDPVASAGQRLGPQAQAVELRLRARDRDLAEQRGE